MDNLFNEFIRERVYICNLSPRTIHYYKQVYRTFKGVGAFEDLSKPTLADCLIAFRERGMSVEAINTYIKGINAYLNWLHEEKGYDKLALKKMKAAQSVMRSLTDKEIKQLMTCKPVTNCDKRLKILTLTLLDTGLRLNEALTLERKNLDFDNLLMTVLIGRFYFTIIRNFGSFFLGFYY